MSYPQKTCGKQRKQQLSEAVHKLLSGCIHRHFLWYGGLMSKQKQSLTKEQNHRFSKPLLEEMVYKLLLQIDDMNDKFGELTEAINVMKSEKYGRST